jgi:hypothetical protein
MSGRPSKTCESWNSLWLPVIGDAQLHALAGRRTVSLADLVGRQWVLPAKRCADHAASLTQCSSSWAGAAAAAGGIHTDPAQLLTIRTSDMWAY